MQETANKMNVHHVQLTSNPARVAANRLYQELGFERYGWGLSGMRRINIYYINFAKVYEIKMMLGNEISTSKNVEHGENSAVNAQLNGNLKFNLLAKSGGGKRG